MPTFRTDLSEYNWESFYKEFQEESPRAAVVLSGAFLDELLTDLLSSFMIQNDDAVKQLLGKTKNYEESVTSSLAAKIKLSYCLGLISENENHDLVRIKNIRNRFSHKIHGFTFEDKEIIKLCDELKTPKQFQNIFVAILSTPQGKYIFTVSHLLSLLGLRILEVQKDRRIKRGDPQLVQVIRTD